MKRPVASALAALLFGTATGAALLYSHVRAASAFERAALVDQQGRRFTLAAFAGRRLLVGFATASEGANGACASISGKFEYLQHHIDPARIHLMQLSADPADDSAPGILPAYARAYGIDASRWTVATGTQADVSVADGALISAASAAKIGNVFGDTVGVIDEHGRLRAVLDASTMSPDALVREALKR